MNAPPKPPNPDVEQALLQLFVARAQKFADAVRIGEMGFFDAVFIVADAARDSGLADGVRDRRLQRAAAFAFMGPLPMKPMAGDLPAQKEEKGR